MIGQNSKFDTANSNFFTNKPAPQVPPVGAPDKVHGPKKPEEVDKAKKQENPLAKTNIFDFSKKEGNHFVMFETEPAQPYDGHKVGHKFHSEFC